MLDGSPTETPAPAGGAGRRSALTDPTVLAVALYALLALLAAVAAYFTIFTEFAPYDDEGTLLVTLKAFVHGGALYRDIYSEYGPFYYELFGGFFSLTGQAVTNDASRSIVVVVWVVASLFFGVSAQRLTGRLAIGLVGMAAAFGALSVLANEPMHPQGLCVLLLGGFFLVATREPLHRPSLAGAGCGALLAALVLTKVNLGIFAVAGVVVAVAWTVPAIHRRAWLRWLIVAGFLAIPVLVTARDLKTGWIRELALLEMLAMAALLAAAWHLQPRSRETDRVTWRWLLAAAGAFVAGLVAILVVIVITGPSPADVYDGLVTQAMRVRDVLITQFPFPPSALDWGIGAVVVAILVARLRGDGTRGPSFWPGALRLAAGLTILFSVAHIVPFGLNPSAGNPDVLPMLLAWVAAAPPASWEGSGYQRLLRVMLPAIAIAETLQVYPVAGSQVGIASVSFVPVAAVCLADGLSSLREWSAERGGLAPMRLATVASVVLAALALEFALDTMGRAAVTSAVNYGELEELPLPGATDLHLQPSEVETYAGLAALVHRYHCTTFVGYPNLNSLYLWTGIEPPAPAAPGAWIKALDEEEQQRVVDEMRASPRPCVIRSQTRAEAWLNGTPAPDLPLVNYVLNDFEKVAEVGDFEFALPKSEPSEAEGSGGG